MVVLKRLRRTPESSERDEVRLPQRCRRLGAESGGDAFLVWYKIESSGSS